MTSQSDRSVTDITGIDEDAMETDQATQDPDLIIVAGDVIEEDADPDAADGDDLAGDDLAGDDLAGSEPARSDRDDYAISGSPTDHNGHTADLGQQWHDIQAKFVDDPRGSVELAAAATDTAVSALVEMLRQRQSALAPAGSTSADGGSSTEQLREALRSYRIFCQSLTEIGQRLGQPTTMTQSPRNALTAP